jgi:hypothetical protein
MGLTRPKIWDLDTTIEYFKDPITVLHQGASSPNVDVGFLFNRANGLVANVAMVWQESTQSFVYAYTSSTGATDSNVVITANANITVGNVLFVNGAGLYVNGTLGTNGQVLGSNGTSLAWVSGGGFTGGSIANQLTVANSTSSTSTTTGALVVTGGAGIGGDAYHGGNVVYGTPAILNGSSTITSIGTGAKLLDSFATSVYRSAKYILSITDVTNTGYQTSEILLMQDGTNANITSYALMYTSTSSKMTFSSNIISGNVMLWGTGVSANNTVKLARTLIPV